MPMAGWRRRRFAAARLAGRRHADELARVTAARQEADYLHHVHDELAKLKPEPGEEEALAERRAAMMQAEKVVGDLRDAHETFAGDGSPVKTTVTPYASTQILPPPVQSRTTTLGTVPQP